MEETGDDIFISQWIVVVFTLCWVVFFTMCLWITQLNNLIAKAKYGRVEGH